MSVLRSPNGGGVSQTYGESQPNPSVTPDFDTPKITFRNKRRSSNSNDCVIEKILDVKKQMAEMMSFTASSSVAQTENINRLYQDVSAMKGQVDKICNNIESIIIEQEKLKVDVSNVMTSTSILGNKIELLEKEVEGLKFKSLHTQESASMNRVNYNKMIAECQERSQRAKNIIVCGVIEATSENAIERLEYDRKEIIKLTKMASSNCPEPENIHRLGKYQHDKIRPIKAIFKSEDTVKVILRNRNNMAAANVKIYSDQTPHQRETLKILKQELENRISNGETNISIKYVKGEPAIVESLPKNSAPATNNLAPE